MYNFLYLLRANFSNSLLLHCTLNVPYIYINLSHIDFEEDAQSSTECDESVDVPASLMSWLDRHVRSDTRKKCLDLCGQLNL